MKAHVSKLLMTAAVGSMMFLGTGCEDVNTAMWWMPSPWTPVSVTFTTSSGSSGSTDGGGGSNTGGGGSNFNTGGGYNVGGGVPGLGM